MEKASKLKILVVLFLMGLGGHVQGLKGESELNLITRTHGNVNYFDCIPMAWKFSSASGVIIVKFKSSHIPNCTLSELKVEIDDRASVSYCGAKKPTALLSGKNITITYAISRQNCGGSYGFALSYCNARVIIGMQNFALTGSSIEIELMLADLLSGINTTCQYGINGGQPLNWYAPRHFFINHFNTSGSVQYESFCSIEAKRNAIYDTRKIIIQDDLSHLKLSETLAYQVCERIGESRQITVNNSFAYPVTYHLWLKPISGRNSLQTEIFNYTEEIMQNRRNMVMNFNVTVEEQDELGPGKHVVMVMIENELSQDNVSFSLCLSKELVLKVQKIKYIDLSPGASTIKIKLEGAPATIQLQLRDRQNKRSVKNVVTFCNNQQKCEEVFIQMSAPYRGVFDIVVTANNSLGKAESTLGPVESFRLLHDIHVIVPPFRIAEKVAFVVLYKGFENDGLFNLELTANKVHSFWRKHMSLENETFSSVMRNFSSLKIPFNPSTYYVYKNETADRAGNWFGPGRSTIEARVYTDNGKQEAKKAIEVIVLEPRSAICLSGVSIQDGRSQGYLATSFDGHARILLSARVEMGCQIPVGDRVQYRWKVFKVNVLSETPDYSKKVKLTIAKDTDELRITTGTLEPGLYLVKVLVMQNNQGGEVLVKFEDFSSVEIPAGRVEVQICGGNKREIGRNISEVEFDASCSVNRHLTGRKFFWFCSLSITDLPTEAAIGFFQRKGSCFGWTPSFVKEGMMARIRLEDVKSDDRFFVRVFASIDGRDEDFYDQEIEMLPFAEPSISIECWTNCGKYPIRSEPMILHAICDSCDSYKWSGAAGPGGVSQNEDFFRALWLGLANHSSRVYVTGFKSGRNATAVYERQFGRAPSRKCKLMNELGVTGTKLVTLDCAQDEKTFVSFYLESVLVSTLIQYGYGQRLSQLHLPYGYFTLRAKICSLDGVCFSDPHIVSGTDDSANVTGMEVDLSTAVKSRNVQMVARIASLMRARGEPTNNTKRMLFDFALNQTLVSLESARVCLDLLGISLSNESEVISRSQGRILAKLSAIKDAFIDSSDSESFLTASTFDSLFMKLAATIMEAKSSSQSDGHRIANELMQTVSLHLFDHLLPGESPRIFFLNSMTRIMARFQNGQDLKVKTDEVAVDVESSDFTDKDPSNMLVYRFLSDNMKFGSGSEMPDEVLALSFTKSRKLPGIAKHEKRSFNPSTSVKYGLRRHRREPEFTELEFEEFVPTGPKPKNRIWRTNAYFAIKKKEADALKIQLKFRNATKREIAKIPKIDLHLWDMMYLGGSKFYVNKTVNGSDFLPDGSYTWTIPTLRGHVVFELAMQIYHSVSFALDFLPYAIRCSARQDMTNDWSSEGCKTSNGSTWDSWSWCECFLRGSRSGTSIYSPKLLSSTIVVYPNKMHWSYMRWNIVEEFYDNPIVICTGLVMHVIFAIGFVLAWRRDKKDFKMPPYIEVADNLPSERYRYLVTVFTGSRRRAGPTSTVSLGLAGKEGRVIHVIQKHGERILRRGSVVTFLMTTRRSLGDITMVRLWHQNEGSNPDWYLDRVSVRDFETDRCFFFFAERWLSDHMGNGRIDALLRPGNFDRLFDFGKLVSIKTGLFLRDRHIWFSLFSMSSWSVHDMTRTQRVGYCMMLTFMLKLTSLMFFKTSAYSIDQGHYTFQWYDVGAGIATTVLILPITFMVSVVFRSCRERSNSYRRDPRKVPRSIFLRPVPVRRPGTNPPRPPTQSRDSYNAGVTASGTSHRPRCSEDVPAASGYRGNGAAPGSSHDRSDSAVAPGTTSHGDPRMTRPIPRPLDSSDSDSVPGNDGLSNRNMNLKTSHGFTDRKMVTGSMSDSPLSWRSCSDESPPAKKDLPLKKIMPKRKRPRPSTGQRDLRLSPELSSLLWRSYDGSDTSSRSVKSPLSWRSYDSSDAPSHAANSPLSWRSEDSSSGVPSLSGKAALSWRSCDSSSDAPSWPSCTETAPLSWRSSNSSSDAPSWPSCTRGEPLSWRSSNSSSDAPSWPSCIGSAPLSWRSSNSSSDALSCTENEPLSWRSYDSSSDASALAGNDPLSWRSDSSSSESPPCIEQTGSLHDSHSSSWSTVTDSNTDTSGDEYSSSSFTESEHDQPRNVERRIGPVHNIGPSARNSFFQSPRFHRFVENPASVDNRPMPWFFVYSAWLAIVAVTCYSSIMNIWFGMTFGYSACRRWLVSFICGLLASMFIVEPLKAVILAYVNVWWWPNHDINDWIPPVRTEVELKRYENAAERSRFICNDRRTGPSYRLPIAEDVKKQSADHLEKRLFWRRMKDMSVHVIYLVLLITISFGLHDSRAFKFQKPLNSMFKVDTKGWGNIRLPEHVLSWIEGPVFDALYGGTPPFPEGQLLVISAPTIRQQRYAKSPPCTYDDPIQAYLDTCKAYQVKSEEVGAFSPGWMDFSGEEIQGPYNKTDSPWKHRAEGSMFMRLRGQHGDIYLPGGYVAQLTFDGAHGKRLIQHLRANGWIDGNTRLVVMETVLYNTDVNLYCIVSMAFEFTSIGPIQPSLQMDIMQSHYVQTLFDYVLLAGIFALLGMVLYFTYNIMSLAWECGYRYYTDAWNILEILILLSSIAAVVVYLSKATFTDQALHSLKVGEAGISLFYAASYLDYLLVCMLSFSLFFTMLRTVAIMEGHKHFKLSYATLHRLLEDLPGHMLCLLVGFLAFFFSGMISFRDMLDFSTPIRATQSIVAYATGAYMSNLLEKHPIFGGLFLLVFFFVYMKLFVNFFAFIVENSYRESKLLLRKITRQDFVTFRRKQIRSLFAIEARNRIVQQQKEAREKKEAENRAVTAWLEVIEEREELAALRKEELNRIQIMNSERDRRSFV